MQPLKFVMGFVPKVDRRPRDVERLGLIRRFAFVLETYHPDHVDAYFDSALYEGLVNVVRNVVEEDTIRIVTSSRSTRDVTVADEFHKLMEGIPEPERDPFPRLLFLLRSSVVAVIESEPWAHVGGPEPYHDSYTLAVFSAVDLSERLMARTRSFCEETGAEVSEVIQGVPNPIKPRPLDAIKRVINWR